MHFYTDKEDSVPNSSFENKGLTGEEKIMEKERANERIGNTNQDDDASMTNPLLTDKVNVVERIDLPHKDIFTIRKKNTEIDERDEEDNTNNEHNNKEEAQSKNDEYHTKPTEELMEHISTKETIITDTGEHGLHVLGNAIDLQVNEKKTKTTTKPSSQTFNSIDQNIESEKSESENSFTDCKPSSGHHYKLLDDITHEYESDNNDQSSVDKALQLLDDDNDDKEATTLPGKGFTIKLSISNNIREKLRYNNEEAMNEFNTTNDLEIESVDDLNVDEAYVMESGKITYKGGPTFESSDDDDQPI